MYTPHDIAEAMAELFDGPKWEGGVGATTIAWRNLWDRVASETGLGSVRKVVGIRSGIISEKLIISY